MLTNNVNTETMNFIISISIALLSPSRIAGRLLCSKTRISQEKSRRATALRYKTVRAQPPCLVALPTDHYIINAAFLQTFVHCSIYTLPFLTPYAQERQPLCVFPITYSFYARHHDHVSIVCIRQRDKLYLIPKHIIR